jgi:hypothetical protein
MLHYYGFNLASISPLNKPVIEVHNLLRHCQQYPHIIYGIGKRESVLVTSCFSSSPSIVASGFNVATMHEGFHAFSMPFEP